MEEQKKKLLIRGAVIGGIIGGAAIALNSKSKVCPCLTKMYTTTTDVLKFLNENRTEIIEQLKTTSEKFTKVVDETNQDLKALTENIKHLKESSSEMVTTVQETKDQLVNMYETCKQKFDEENITQILDEKKDA